MTVQILLFGTLAFDLGIANASCQEAPTFIYSLRVCNADCKIRFIYLIMLWMGLVKLLLETSILHFYVKFVLGPHNR